MLMTAGKMFAERRRSDGLSAAGRVVKWTIPMLIDRLMAATEMAEWQCTGIITLGVIIRGYLFAMCAFPPLGAAKSCTIWAFKPHFQADHRMNEYIKNQ